VSRLRLKLQQVNISRVPCCIYQHYMQVVRRAGARLHLRVPNAKAVREWAMRVEGLESDIAAIQAQERQEMELRRAEMQATKVRCLRVPDTVGNMRDLQ
jgi:hypothetical protein